MKPVEISVHDRMQTGYRYLRTEMPGKNFHPDFHPDLTPKQMLELGVFGGKYMTDCGPEFPEDWLEHAKLCHEKHDPELNYFKILASQTLQEWIRKGWIYHEDPRGWFQWYCRYYQGRRCPDDERQVRRWNAMRRHAAQIHYHCAPGERLCRSRQRQALLQWAYDSRKF